MVSRQLVASQLTALARSSYLLATDCAVCTEGYGRGVSNHCHSCDNPKGKLLISAAVLLSVVAILVLFLAAVYLIGGLDAVKMVRQSVTRSVSKSVSRGSVQELDCPERRHTTNYSNLSLIHI